MATKANSLIEVLEFAKYLVCPTPFSKNNLEILNFKPSEPIQTKDFLENLNKNHIVISTNIPKNVKSFCFEKNIHFEDLMDSNEFAILNAIATAEGAIVESIKNSSFNIHGSSVLVLGFGRCAKILAKKLKSLDANVFVAARKLEDLAFAKSYGYNAINLKNLNEHLPNFDFIFNTIPTEILPYDKIALVKNDCVIIDIASNPGGVCLESCEKLGINAGLYLGLPGKYAPKTSGEIIANIVNNIIEGV